MKSIILLLSLLGKEISGQICDSHQTRTPLPLVDVGVCPSSHPDEDNLLCYENCKSNYNAVGPVCWENCDGDEVGVICVTTPLSSRTKKSYGRGAANVCASNKMNVAGLCYNKCKSGYSRSGFFCQENGCPGGYADHGASCFKWDWFNSKTYWKKSYGIGIGILPSYAACKSGYFGNGPVCWETCRSGETDDGVACRIPEVSHLRPSYGRGVGVSLVCPAGHEQVALDCYPWCNEGYTGLLGTCTNDQYSTSVEGILATALVVPILISGCNIDTLIKGTMMLDTLSGHDFAGDGFDLCAVDDALAGIDDSWGKDSGIFAVEFRVGYSPPVEFDVPDEIGFLGIISSILSRDYTNYDNFRADIAEHADEQTLNDLDIFLRWLWEEILNESAINVYVGLAFETHSEGMDVYLYYGHCDGSVTNVGLNQMVYRSVRDIDGPQQVHAPTIDIFKIALGWVYGLDSECGLKAVGMHIGLGEDAVSFDWEHLADEDGLQCETRQVIQLTNGQPAAEAAVTDKPVVVAMYNYPSCEPDCLREEKYQIEDAIYRIESTGKCYRAITGCWDCLKLGAEKYPDALAVVDCPSRLLDEYY